MRRRLGMLALAAVVVLVVGCSKELLAGGQTKGEVTTTMNDGPGSQSARSDGARSTRLLRTVLPAGTGPQGTVQATVQAALVDEKGTADVIAPSTTASVGIGATAGPELGRDSVHVGLYTVARVTFSSVTADITGGLLAAGGLPIAGRVTVQLAAPVTVDVPIALDVRAGSEHRVIIDLNASTWLAAVDPVTLTVPASAFRSALAVRTE